MSDKTKAAIKETVGTIVYLGCVLLATWLLIKYVGQRTVVDGSSMVPTLSHNDNLIVDKISYRFRDPERFDIVVFPYRYAENTFYIKRIIGMPGETIQIDEQGNIYIDGERLEENYGREIIDADKRGRAAEPVVLGENEYFVMGDNRNNSADSRTNGVGNVTRDEFIGRAWMRVWPFSGFGILKHQ